MGFVEPITTGALISLIGSGIGVGAKLWGEKSAEEQIKDAQKAAAIKAKRAEDQARRAAIRQAEEVARQEAAAEQQSIIAEAEARRNLTMTALYGIGGAALVLSGLFIFKAVKPGGSK
jgi:hypothetical protein